MKRAVLIILTLLCPLALRGEALPSHPRLLLHSGEEQKVRDAIASQTLLSSVDSVIVSYSRELLSEKPIAREKSGMRLMNVTNLVPRRIFYLAYTYRIHGGEEFFVRAKQEMDALCEFSDWNPSHFLDVAGCALALSIGYDWFYDKFSPQDREKYFRSMKEKAFVPSLDTAYSWFYRSDTNWNQVCNAGLLYGALAFWEQDTEAASNLLQACLDTNPLVLREGYSTEGGYAEGYGYWGYGSSWQMMLFAALESVFGNSSGLMESYPGFLRSGKYMQMMTTPLRRCYNYGDNGPGANAQTTLFYLAAKSGNISFLYREVQEMRRSGFKAIAQPEFLPMIPIYCAGLPLDSIPVPQDRFYVCSGRTPLFLYRSGWSSEKDSYLAVKAGMMASNHGHSDVGSFYFEADGVNWAAELGVQAYGKLEAAGVDLWNRFQNSGRYDVFRIGPYSHNIITVNDTRPDVIQNIPFRRVWQENACKGAELDLHMVYWEDLSAYVRTVQLNEDDSVLSVRDSLTVLPDSLSLRPGQPSTLRWGLCTRAEVEVIDSGSVRLKQGPVSRVLRAVLERGGATVHESHLRAVEESTEPHRPYDEPNPGTTMVCFYFDLDPGESAVLNVSLSRE